MKLSVKVYNKTRIHEPKLKELLWMLKRKMLEKFSIELHYLVSEKNLKACRGSV
jgi:hypothetical protein